MIQNTRTTRVRKRRQSQDKNYTHLMALLCMSMFIVDATIAQETSAAPAEASITLKEVVVSGTAVKETATGPVEGYRATRSSTATRTDTPLNEIPQSITVISADQIEDQNAQTMQETLQYTAGVRSEMYGLDNRGDWFTMRGGSEGSTVLDGLRLPLSGWYGVVRNDPFAFERVEVLRGPASVVAGANGPGGVVNLVSKRPQDEARREVSAQVGTYNHHQVSTDLTGPVNEDGSILYRVVALWRESDTQVEYADMSRQYIAPSFTFKLSEDTALTIYTEYQNDESRNTEGFFPWAGTLYAAPNGFIPMDTFVGEPDWDFYGGERVRIGYELESALNDTWSVRHNLRHDQIDGKLRGMYANFWEVDAAGVGYGSNELGDNRTIGRSWYATDDKDDITLADLYTEGHFDGESVDHVVLFGIDGRLTESSQKSDGGDATPLDVYAPVYGTFPLPALNFGPALITEVEQVGSVLQDQIKIVDRWVVTAGLRYDNAETSVDGVTSTDDEEFTKNLGLVFLADHGFSPYVGYSESFEPIADTDKEGNAFDPKQGEQIEAGVKWGSADHVLGATLSVFELKETGRLSEDPTDPNYSVQRGEVTVQGVELESTANLKAWDFTAAYTYTDAKQTSSSDPEDPYLGHQLASIPEHAVALWGVHTFTAINMPGLRAGLGVRYTDETWDGTDTISVPSYTLFDTMLSYEHGPYRYALNVSNLTDEEYIVTALDRGDCWYGTRREAVLSVSYLF